MNNGTWHLLQNGKEKRIIAETKKAADWLPFLF
jgi:hypothetical protein